MIARPHIFTRRTALVSLCRVANGNTDRVQLRRALAQLDAGRRADVMRLDRLSA
jgi:hypothetical protein